MLENLYDWLPYPLLVASLALAYFEYKRKGYVMCAVMCGCALLNVVTILIKWGIP